MKLFCLSSLAALLLGLPGSAAAGRELSTPEFLVSNWRNEEGLPHSIINSIKQTHDGYLWIGTYVGLVRFDGARFVHFSPGDMPELQDGRISILFEDRDDVLWIGLESGRLVAWKDGVARVHLPGSASQDQPIVSIAQDKEGIIWLQTADAQFGHLTTNGVQFLARTGQGLARPSLGLIVDPEGRLWVGTGDGVKLWRDGALITPPGLDELTGRIADALAPARDGAIWMYRDGQLWKVRTGGIVAHYYAPANFTDFAAAIVEAAGGRVWIAASEGTLFCLEPSGEWTTVQDPGLRGWNRVLYEDREGNLWRGSFGGGLTRIRPRLFTLHELPESELDRYAMTVCADRSGNVWGLLNGHTLARIPAGESKPEIRASPPGPRTIRSLHCDHRNTIWAGMDNGYLQRLRGEEFEPLFKVDPQAEFISALFEDSKSNLWVGFTGGAGVGVMPDCDPTRWRLLDGMPFPGVRCIAEAADGAMWFGTHYGGVSRWQNGQWTQFTTRDGLSSDYVRCLYADPDGTLWLGTLRGVCRWRDGKFVAIKAADGLWNESISHIADDGRGNFWMTSFGGVFRVKRDDLNDFADGRRASVPCVGYNRNDGLISLECPGGFQPAGTKTPDGRLWFPTVSGLVSVAPDEIKENALPPPVWIEEVTVDGESGAVRRSTSALEIGPGKRRFDFRFTALSLTSPEKVRFRHKLEGLDDDWALADGLRTVTYSYIPPGRYTFRVIASNNDGVWNMAGSSIDLTIQPFFWQTWWFKGGVALLLAVAIAVTARRVERWNAQLRVERLEQQHAVERERSRIARDIHDDLGANLTQIVFLSQRVEGTSHDEQEVARWIHKIPATARRTIQSLDEIVWAINPRHDTLESLANYLSQFAQEHLTLAGVRCALDVPTVLPVVALTAEIRHNLLLAAREAVQNAVAHADATEVRVTLELISDGLNIVVADNGCGFDPEQKLSGDGNGLRNMRRRLEDLGGQLDITSRASGGTTVRLFVPRTRLHGRVVARNGPPA